MGGLGKQTPELEELLLNNPISNKSSIEKLDSFYHKIAVAYALADIGCLFGSVAYLSYQSGIKNTLEAAKARESFDNMLSTDQTLSQVKKVVDGMNSVILEMNHKAKDLEKKMDNIKLRYFFLHIYMHWFIPLVSCLWTWNDGIVTNSIRLL